MNGDGVNKGVLLLTAALSRPRYLQRRVGQSIETDNDETTTRTTHANQRSTLCFLGHFSAALDGNETARLRLVKPRENIEPTATIRLPIGRLSRASRTSTEMIWALYIKHPCTNKMHVFMKTKD